MQGLGNVAAPYRKLLDEAGLKSFEDVWRLDWDWVEAPNRRRGGWSGATRLQLKGHESLSLFVKRQENYCYRSLAHPLRGRPTFYREWRNIERLRAAQIPTLEPVCYAERRWSGRYQAALLTVALDEHQELDQLFADRVEEGLRERVLCKVGKLVRRLHDARFQHNCLGGNHLMIRPDPAGIDLRLLDLEKLKTVRRELPAAARDLARFIRHTPSLQPTDHLRVLAAYTRDWSRDRRAGLVNLINAQLARKHQQHGRPVHTPLLPDSF